MPSVISSHPLSPPSFYIKHHSLRILYRHIPEWLTAWIVVYGFRSARRLMHAGFLQHTLPWKYDAIPGFFPGRFVSTSPNLIRASKTVLSFTPLRTHHSPILCCWTCITWSGAEVSHPWWAFYSIHTCLSHYASIFQIVFFHHLAKLVLTFSTRSLDKNSLLYCIHAKHINRCRDTNINTNNRKTCFSYTPYLLLPEHIWSIRT